MTAASVAPVPRPARWLPGVAAVAAGIVGIVNVVSTLTPNITWRHHALLQLEPVEWVPVLHAVVLPAGAALVIVARYLAARRQRAWQLAFGLLLVLGIVNLLKGLDFEEALAGWILAAVLWRGRSAFYVRHGPITLRSAAWRVPLVAAAVTALAAVAAWASAPVPGRLATVARETADLVLWQPGPIRFHGELARLPVAVAVAELAALVALAYLLFRPLAMPHALPDLQARRVAADLVRAHGSDTLAAFKLRTDTHYLFDREYRAFVAYRVESGVMVLSGDPVGAPEALPELLAEVLAFARRHGLRVAAVGASEALLDLYAQAGLRSFYMGDEAIVETAGFSLEGRRVRKVRQAITRLVRAGYSVEVQNVAQIDEPTLHRLEAISSAWRAGAAERGFSMALDRLCSDHLPDGVVVLARDCEGAIRGFLHFVPASGRPAMSLAFMRREPDTPNGLTEFLVVRAIELLREQGVAELSLNFAAFARILHSPSGPVDRLLGRLVAVANPYFQIESLYRFNAKFFPRWQPRYLIYEGALGLPRAGLATLWVEGQLPKPRLPRRDARDAPAGDR